MPNKYDNSNVLIVIPAYNESYYLPSVLDKVLIHFKNILVINDCSNDKTLDLIKEKNIKIISHKMNLGQGAALETGFLYFLKNTTFDYLVTFDGDGQHNINDAKKMVDYAKKFNYQAVIGSRFLKKKSIKMIPILKRITLILARFYEYHFFSVRLTDAHNGLRVLSRNLIEKVLPIKRHDMAHATEISHKICKMTDNFSEFPVKINYLDKKSQSPINSLNIIIHNLIKR